MALQADTGFSGPQNFQSQEETDTVSTKGIKADGQISVSGGEFVIVSDGDCLDSNGALTISGGTLDLTCSGNGNTALDCDGTYTHSGGDVTTNDGSEENPGQMGGCGGMPSQGGGRPVSGG